MSEIIDKSINLPESVNKIIAMRIAIAQKVAEIVKREKDLKAAKTKLMNMLKADEEVLLKLHKEHGDFEVEGLTVKTSTSWSTVVLDESKLPGSCFKIEKTVSLTAVKELILEGKIPREVAIQQKNESIKIK